MPKQTHRQYEEDTHPNHKAVDLFCGCGGLTLGLKQAGYDVIGAVDNDALAVSTYKQNHRDVTVFETDIRLLTVAKVKRRLGLKKEELDLLAGCPPCQGFSTMRTLNTKTSVRDRRNTLIREFWRFVEGLKPNAVMFENVPRIKDYRVFKEFCARLRRMGYTMRFDVLNAADYGVPQRRRRLILIAMKNGPVKFAEKVRRRRTVRDAIGGLKPAGSSGDWLHDLPERRTVKVTQLIEKIPKNGGNRMDLGEEAQLACHKRCDGFKDVYGRMAWDDVAPTITSGCSNPSKGRFLHPEENRAITMREAAVLQGFPRQYKFHRTTNKSAAAQVIGNALPPPFIAAHAKCILQGG